MAVLSTKAAGEILYATEWNNAVSHINNKPISLSAISAIQPDTVGTLYGATITQSNLTTGKFPLPYAVFRDSTNRTNERICWMTVLNSSYGTGNYYAQADVVFPTNQVALSYVYLDLRAVRVNSPGSIDQTPANVIYLRPGCQGDGAMAHKTHTLSTSFTISGSGNLILWELRRSDNVLDTITGDVYFVNVNVYPE
jgi:hypothetical protein